MTHDQPCARRNCRIRIGRACAISLGCVADEWPYCGVLHLSVRRGESRHQVLFLRGVDAPLCSSKKRVLRLPNTKSRVLRELADRGCRTLEPVGFVVTHGEPVAVGEIGGRTVYMSGDTGYCITRLAERVLPQSILYRYPFNDENKRLLWNAIAELLLDLHETGCLLGDPSLANVLIDLHDERLTAVMADAETAESVDGPLSEGLRRQDLESFVESIEWQAEDIRLARNLPEETELVTENDASSTFSFSRYARSARRSRSCRANARNAARPTESTATHGATAQHPRLWGPALRHARSARHVDDDGATRRDGGARSEPES